MGKTKEVAAKAEAESKTKEVAVAERKAKEEAAAKAEVESKAKEEAVAKAEAERKAKEVPLWTIIIFSLIVLVIIMDIGSTYIHNEMCTFRFNLLDYSKMLDSLVMQGSYLCRYNYKIVGFFKLFHN